MIDRATKTILLVIAVGLLLNAAAPFLRPPAVRAQHAGMDCTGELKANAWGGTVASVGGYSMKLTCK
jgi:hypothetical protein